MTDLRQDDFKVEMEGTVTPPPAIEAVLARIADAALYKQEITLTPGEARILNGYIEERS